MSGNITFRTFELKGSPPKVKTEWNFFSLPAEQRLEEIFKFDFSDFEDFIVIGIGGSSLGAKGICNALKPEGLKVHFLESPESLIDFLPSLSKDFFLNPISKSGNTLETLTIFFKILDFLGERYGVGVDELKGSICITTGKGGKLREFAQEHGIKTLDIPETLPGRFSTFYVGLLPLYAGGVDIKRLLEGAKLTVGETLAHALLNLWEQGKRTLCFMFYSERLFSLSENISQLFGESLGKSGYGFTPLMMKGPHDQHTLSQLIMEGPKDKAVIFIWAERQDTIGVSRTLRMEMEATMEAFEESGVPTILIELPLNEEGIGEFLFNIQVAVACIGTSWGINPFDQPAVERIKTRFK